MGILEKFFYDYIYGNMYAIIYIFASHILVERKNWKFYIRNIPSFFIYFLFLNFGIDYLKIFYLNGFYISVFIFITTVVLYKKHWKNYIGIMTILDVSLSIIDVFILNLIPIKSIYSLIAYYSLFIIGVVLLVIVNIKTIWESFCRDKKTNILVFGLFSLYGLYLTYILYIVEVEEMSFNQMLLSLIFFACIFIYYYYKKTKELSATLVLQQEEYIKSLESMQEDIRKYNHDYKNLLTGALLQAKEGDYEGVQNYLQDVLDEFELKLGKQISKNTQLKKINSNELKGLLLSKITEMEDKNIEFHLEVLNEVDKINMKSTDLVRCLGILLDNAIEEVEKIDEKIISLVILQEENITTIMVKNPVTEKINIQSIYEDNYSTKGAKRGLGLSNYREIIENYENIVRETICTEEEFNQVLKIG